MQNKPTTHTKAIHSIITEMKGPYNYRETTIKLDEVSGKTQDMLLAEYNQNDQIQEKFNEVTQQGEELISILQDMIKINEVAAKTQDILPGEYNHDQNSLMSSMQIIESFISILHQNDDLNLLPQDKNLKVVS